MAESIGELYMRIGLDISDLESDFVNAEKTLTENLNKLSREQHLIQIRGQIELDGLEESASASEKVRVQAEALNKQMELQRDKIALVSAAYQQLVRTQGENAESTQSAAFQLEKEKLALSNLEKQTRDLSKQQEIALGVNTEMLGLIPTAVKAVDAAVQAGRTLPIPVGHAKVLAGVVAGLAAVAAGSYEATQEMRDDNPAKVLSEDFEQAQEDIDASWQEVLSTTEQSTGDMTSTVEDSFSEMADGITESVEEISDTVEDCTSNISKIVDILKSNSADEALSKTIAYFEEMDSVVGDIIADILKVIQTKNKINTTAVEMATPAIQGFRELSLAARELNLSLDKTNDLLGEISLAGGEYNDIRDYVRGVQDAVIKGEWGAPEVLALERYGITIQDANGHLLAFDETLERLYEGYLKAREAGEAEAYVMMTNGQAVQDVLPFFEKWAQAKEDNNKIQWSILDKASLAEASRNMKLADTQIEEFKNQLSSLAVPMASAALESTFETFHKLTEVLQENRETIIYWSFVAIEAMNSVKSIANDFGISITGAAGSATDKLAELAEKFAVLDKVKNFLVDAKNTVVEWGNSLTGAQQSWADFQRQSHGDEQTLNPFANADKQMEKWRKSNQQAQGEIQKTNEELVGLGYSLKRIAEYQKELANVQLDLDFGKSQMLQVANVSQQAGSLVMSFRENIYQKAIAQENLWLEEALKSAKAYKDEQEAIYKLHAAKLERIEYEKEKRLAEIRESVYKDERSELENRLIDIEREKQTWIDAGMEEAEATELAQKKITQAYEEREAKLNDIRESVYSLDRTDLENKLANIDKEKEAWIAAGMDIAEAESLAQRKALKVREDALQKARDLIQNTADIEYSLTHSAFEKQLRDIEQWKQAQMEKAETVEEVAATIQNAAMKEAESFEREIDRIKGKIETLQDKIFEQEHSQYEKDLRRAAKERADYYAEGVYPSAMIERWFKNEINSINKKAREDKGANYTKSPYGGSGGGIIEFNQAVEQGTKSLTEMDAAQLAQQALLKQINNQIDLYNGALSKTNLATTEFANSLKNTQADQFNQAMAQIGGATTDFSKALSGLTTTAGVLSNAERQNAQSIAGVVSNLQTMRQALITYKNIEEQKAISPEPPKDNKQSAGFEIIYGNQPTQPEGGFEIIYGNLDAEVGRFGAELDDAEFSLDGTIDRIDDKLNELGISVENLDQTISEIPEQQQPEIPDQTELPDEITQQFSKLAEDISPIGAKLNYFSSEIESAGKASELVSIALLQAASAIDDISKKIAQIEFKPQIVQPVANTQNKNDNVNNALDATATISKIFAMAISDKVKNLVMDKTLISETPKLEPINQTPKFINPELPQMDISPLKDKLTTFNAAIENAGAASERAADMFGNSADTLSNKLDELSKASVEIPQIDTKLDFTAAEQQIVDFAKSFEPISEKLSNFGASIDSVNTKLLQLEFKPQAAQNQPEDINIPSIDFTPIEERLTAFSAVIEDTSSRLSQINFDIGGDKLNQTLDEINAHFDSIKQNLTETGSDLSAFNNSIVSAGDASANVASAFNLVAERLSELSLPQIAMPDISTPEYSYNIDNVGADNQILQLIQAQGTYTTELTSSVNQLTSSLSQSLIEMTQQFGAMAQSIERAQNQRPQQNITVSPNINIDLGGAYVFDNSMRQRLVDDITTDVANAVTDAVKNAAGQASYGFGN